jgi:hypothetical protein
MIEKRMRCEKTEFGIIVDRSFRIIETFRALGPV